jgi:hypothetical protein
MSPSDFERMRGQMAGFGARGPGGGPGGGFGRRQGAAGGAMAQAFGQFGEQIRSMPAEQYSGQRLDLAAQAFKQMRGNFPTRQDPQQSLQAFIERYLLSSRIVPTIKEKLAKGTTAAVAQP